MVPSLRITTANEREIRAGRDFVLYWMIASRRTRYNFGLQRAADLARDLRRPLVVLEALRCDYPWASARLHRFAIDGMIDNSASLARGRAAYYPYVEPRPGAGKGLLKALASRACAVVTDDFPCFFLPRMVAAAARTVDVRVEAVDSNGLLPMRAADREFTRAYSLRRYLQKQLPEHLEDVPAERPLHRLPEGIDLPAAVVRRWAPCAAVLDGDREAIEALVRSLPIDQDVPPVDTRGGMRAGERTIDTFVETKLADYGDRRNEPEADATSGLSPYLHFGHVSAHDVFRRLAAAEGWSPGDLAERTDGKREGWWGMGPAAEGFLDELVTWRELGFNMCSQRDDYDRYESLPGWAQQTLADHEGDAREHLYTLEQFEDAATHDDLWNAAQRQLVREGRIHNYLRMLWGKKILEWTRSPREALDVMIELNNKYALDGRNPNSYSGIFWVLGRYDRAWGPERPVYGKIRYMSSANTARKVRVRGYIETYGRGSLSLFAE